VSSQSLPLCSSMKSLSIFQEEYPLCLSFASLPLPLSSPFAQPHPAVNQISPIFPIFYSPIFAADPPLLTDPVDIFYQVFSFSFSDASKSDPLLAPFL